MESVQENLNRRSFLGRSLGATLAAATAVGSAAAVAATPAKARGAVSFTDVIDLTHSLYEGFPTFDGAQWFSKKPAFTYAKDGLNLNVWTLYEHTGTHMDAPLHFSAQGMSVDEIPVGDLVVPLAVIDIRDRAAQDPDATVMPADIRRWESRHGRLPDGCCVVMNSGWHKLLKSPRFVGRDAQGKNHTPGFHPSTTDFLMKERHVKGIGVDTLSLDAGIASGPFPVHNSWLPSGRWGIEALANLDAVPEAGAHLMVGGPKVEGATGGLSRVLALV